MQEFVRQLCQFSLEFEFSTDEAARVVAPEKLVRATRAEGNCLADQALLDVCVVLMPLDGVTLGASADGTVED